jgi:putative acetyltransferase
MDDTPPIEIRQARPSDAEAITAMQSLPGVRWGTLRMPYPRAETMRKRIEAQGDNDYLLLAFVEEGLAGMAGMNRFIGRRAHVAGIGMAVHDEWTGRGIGRRLLGELIDIADNWWGLRRLELEVYVDNAPAIGLYRSMGFVVEGRSRAAALRDGVFVDDYKMARLRDGFAGVT